MSDRGGGSAEPHGSAHLRIDAFLNTLSGTRLANMASSDSYASYLAQPSEIWARVYAQFVTSQTGYARLVREQRMVAQGTLPERYPYILPNDEFVPVADALQALVENFGWSTKRP